MTELWIPQPNKLPDVTNIFDMMLVFQEQLDMENDRNTRLLMAKTAALSLARILKNLHVSERRLSLTTEIAIVDTEPEMTNGYIAENIGILGVMQDVHCISVGDRLPLSVSLDIDVIKTFEQADTDDESFDLNKAIAPISGVHYIERIAS